MAYVYGHYKADTDELFYVGKGTNKRAWDKRNRNVHWKRVVEAHGLIVKIIEDGLSEEQAFIKEKQLIAEVGLDRLANVLEGGEGISSREAQALAKNPEWIQKQKTNSRAATVENPEWVRWNAEKNRRISKDPARNAKMAATMRNKPDVKEKMGAMSKKRWDNMSPEQRAANVARLAEISRNRKLKKE